MIILDTNILSECLRPKPDSRVLAWLSAQPRARLFTTTIVESEILYGVGLLPEGARKAALAKAVHAIFDHDFSGRILSFDRSAAAAYAKLASSRKLAGRPITQFDAMIAAVAYSTGAVLAKGSTAMPCWLMNSRCPPKGTKTRSSHIGRGDLIFDQLRVLTPAQCLEKWQ